jgi:hypothetical protein
MTLKDSLRWHCQNAPIASHNPSDGAHSVITNLHRAFIEIAYFGLGAALGHESLDLRLRVGVAGDQCRDEDCA